MLKEINKEFLYRNLQTISVEKYYKYIREVENGYIKMKRHPENDDIAILNYSELTTYEKRWNEETMSARGLILDTKNARFGGKIYILGKPFDKFFNYSENPEYEKDIDFEENPLVMEKLDGSLGISYFINGEIRFATRGSFTSEQAIKATQIWKDKYACELDVYLYEHSPITYLVEIIYPENRIVVNYGRKEDLIMLGMTYIFDRFQEYDNDVRYENVVFEAERLKMPFAKQFELNINDMIALKKKISANEEGWILRFSNGKRLKIKGDEYIQVHRVMHGLSDKAKVTAWAEDRLQDYIMMMPEEFRPELEGFGENLDKVLQSLYFMLTLIFEEAVEKHGNDRKLYAMYVNHVVSKEFRKFMFVALDKDKIQKDMIRKFMLDNYGYYLGVINSWGTFNLDKQDF